MQTAWCWRGEVQGRTRRDVPGRHRRRARRHGGFLFSFSHFFLEGGDFPRFPQCAYITFIIIYVKKSLFWKKAFNDLDTGVPVFAITWAHLFLSVTAGGHPSRGPRGYSGASRASGSTDRRGGVAWKAPHLLGATAPPQHLALGARRPAPAPAPAASPLPREPAAPPPGGQPAHGIAPFPCLISAGSRVR